MRSKKAASAATEKVVAKKAAPRAAKKACGAAKAPAKVATTFTVHAEAGKAVFLAGAFNGWDPAAKKMAYKPGDGVYAVTIRLAPGTYEYKFVIDGAWCADPENENAVPNDQGTFNSVVTVR